MQIKFRIEELTSAHNVGEFKCPDETMNRFLREKALEEQSRGYSKTYVMVNKDNEDIIAFVTASTSSVDIGDTDREDFPGFDYDEIPAVLLGRVGRDIRYRGGVYGQIMVKYCVGIARNVSEWAGCLVVCIDAYPKKVPLYEKLGFRAHKEKEDQAGEEQRTVRLYYNLAKERYPVRQTRLTPLMGVSLIVTLRQSQQ